MVIQHENTLWTSVKTMAVKPGKGGAYNQVELKNLFDGRKLNIRFRADESIERVRLEQRDFQYLYQQGDELYFMDILDFEQVSLPHDFVGERAAFLTEGMKVLLERHEERYISCQLPQQVVCEIAEADPAIKNQTASSSFKPAILTNGLKVMVPPFINSGEKIIVNTEEVEYVRRAD